MRQLARVDHAYLRHRDSTFQRLKQENSQLIHEDVAARATVFRGLPEVVSFNHTEICNLRCVMCPRNLAQGKYKLSRRAVEHVVKELFPTAWKAVLTAAAGEPLSADFDFLLENALRFDVKLDVVTNGSLLTRDLYRSGRRVFDQLNVSLDCHVPEVYERIRLGGNFARLEQNLAEIHAQRQQEPDDVLLSVSAVVMNSNLQHLPELVRFAHDRIGADGVVLQHLRHDTKKTPEEDVLVKFGENYVRTVFKECEAVAREVGINLYLSDFALPNIEVNPLRAKVPAPREQHETCWFVAQYFGVMYTGDVYPCGSQTDYRLGNVLFQDPMDIWNSPMAQRLRAMHWKKQGSVFCSGCEYAPKLPAREPIAVNQVARRLRVATHHLHGKLRRRREEQREIIFDPKLPEVAMRSALFEREESLARVEAVPYANEVMTVHPRTGDLWWLRRGVVWRVGNVTDEPEWVGEIPGEPTKKATAFQFVSNDRALVSFEEGGTLEQLEFGHDIRRSTVLVLSDPRSFVRQPTLLVHPSGQVWVGEYGLFPGARCAYLYTSQIGGSTFQQVQHIRKAKHVHRVSVFDESEIAVSTGDLPLERCFYRTRRGQKLELLMDRWAGFTAILAEDGMIHCGTDLPRGNALLRFRCDSTGKPEVRLLPSELDFQIRQMTRLDDGRLLVLGSMDADLRRSGLRAGLLVSADHGERWSLVHQFSKDWTDAPEEFVVIPGTPPRIVTVCTPSPVLITLESAIE